MDYTLRSYYIYFGLVIFCLVMGGIAQKRNSKFAVFVIAVVLSLFMGLRKNTVGIDSQNYYWMIDGLKKVSDIKRYNDPIFYLYCLMLKKIIDDPYFVFFVISTITNFLIVYRLWDFKEISSYKYSLLRYFTIFYFFAYNCSRQFLAVSIIFYATKYVDRGNYKKFIIFVLFASTIHISALTSILYITLDIIRKKELSIKQKNVVTLSILVLPITVVLMIYFSNRRYEQYFENLTIINLNSFILKLAIFVVVSIYFYIQKKFKKEDKRLFLYFVYYFVGLAFNGVGVFFRLADRIGYNFYIYSPIYTGIIAKEKKYRLLIRIIILFIVIRSFYLNCYANSMGQMPYLFNWE